MFRPFFGTFFVPHKLQLKQELYRKYYLNRCKLPKIGKVPNFTEKGFLTNFSNANPQFLTVWKSKNTIPEILKKW